MKSLLIAAALAGAAIAGVLLYIQQTEKPKNQLKQTGNDLQRNFTEAIG